MRNWGEIAVIPVAIVMIGGFLGYEFSSRVEPPPDFATMTDVKKKKLAFFEFMLPLVRQANNNVRQERRSLEKIRNKLVEGRPISPKDTDRVRALNDKYQAKLAEPYGPDNLQQLLKRVDTIPASLVLAQSANESAWGTTRFAKKGNNYFGIWCWSRDCGLVPNRRDAGKKHEVASFETIDAGIRYYLLTLNRHPAYGLLRDIRYELRKRNRPIKGHDLAAGLLSYSERGDAYVDEIRAMIRINQLQSLTRLDYDF